MPLPLIMLLAADTLRLGAAPAPVAFDGVVSEAEYGVPALEIAVPAGTALVWMVRDSGFVCLAARIPDRSVSWRDDLVLSLDTRGDRAAAPQHDDFQWDLTRVLDSGVVYRGDAGRWRAPHDDPDWRLGSEHGGGGWEAMVTSDSGGWSLELRLDSAYFSGEANRLPAIALRLFNDDPQAWATWPAPDGLRHPTELERRPARWVVVAP